MSKDNDLQNFLDGIPELKTKDQTRVFFAHFPDKEDKPEQWERKMTSWIDAITESSATLNNFVITSEEIRNRFKKDGIRPECIDEVMVEMENRKLLNSVQSIAASSGNDGWGTWLFDTLIKKPLFSFGSPMKSNQPTKKEGKYVVMTLLKQKSEELLSKYDSKVILVDYLFEKEKQEGSLGSVSDTSATPMKMNSSVKEQFDVILNYLSSQKRVFFFEVGGKIEGEGAKRAVKFSSNSSTVTDVEKGILEIELTAEKLESQANKLEIDIDECTKQAIQVKQKSQEQALLLMKRRKRLRDIHTKRLQSLDTLREILEKIDDAKTNKEILDAYRIGTASIKETTQKYGVTVEAVDQVMDELSEVLADQREIDEAFKTGYQDPSIDEDELENELNKLMEDSLLEQLPKVPVTAPASPGQNLTELLDSLNVESPSDNKKTSSRISAPLTEEDSDQEEKQKETKKKTAQLA